jgi:hypothetical protein
LADGAGGLQSAQAGVDGCCAAKVPEVLPSEYPALSVAVNLAADKEINGFELFFGHQSGVKKGYFFRQDKREVGCQWRWW